MFKTTKTTKIKPDISKSENRKSRKQKLRKYQ